MQRVLMYFCVIIFACAESVFSAQDVFSLPPENIRAETLKVLARMDGEDITYDNLMKQIEVCSEPLSLLQDFYRVEDIPSISMEKLKTVQDFPLRIDFTIDTEKERNVQLLFIWRTNGSRYVGFTAGYRGQQMRFYEEMAASRDSIDVRFSEDKNIESITLTKKSGWYWVGFDRKNASWYWTLFDRESTVTNYEKWKHDESMQKSYQEGITIVKDAVQHGKRHAEVPRDKKITGTLRIPLPLENEEVLKTIKQIDEFFQSLKKGSVIPLIEHKMFKKHSTIYVNIREYLGVMRFIAVKGDNGVFLFIFNHQGQLVRYIEGNVKFNFNRSGKTIVDSVEFDKAGEAVEVLFHPTGYPATYKTIVKGNLFGRQMEWNDKGEIISDIDLDIPTAQKQKEKPVMRTWTSRGGKHTLQAKYISADENQVVLEKEKGEVVVKLSELSNEDRDYVKKQRE